MLQAWVALQVDRGANVAPTDRRLDVIAKVMQSEKYPASQLADYLRWVFKAPARWPGWMRKPGRSYLEVDNLFRKSHLRDHLQEAVEWARANGGGPPTGAIYGDRVYTG